MALTMPYGLFQEQPTDISTTPPAMSRARPVRERADARQVVASGGSAATAEASGSTGTAPLNR
jgi:hypothetical protein